MPKLIQYQCDIPGCSAIRGESNHWFIGVINNHESSSYPTLTIVPFTPLSLSLADNNPLNSSILCGEAHVHEFISANLNKLFPSPQKALVTTFTPPPKEERSDVFVDGEASPRGEKEEEVIGISSINSSESEEVLCIHCGHPIELLADDSSWRHSEGDRFFGCGYYAPRLKGKALRAEPPESVLNASK